MTASRFPGFIRRDGLIAQLVATGAGEAASRLGQILTLALAARYLGVAGVGVAGVAWSLTAVAQTLVQGGTEPVGIGRLAGKTVAPARIIADTDRLKLLFAGAAMPLLLAVQLLLGGGGPALLQLGAQSAAMLALVLGYSWVFRGLERAFEQGALRLGQAAAGFVLTWLLLAAWPSPLALPLAEMVAALLSLAAGRHLLRGLAAGDPAGRAASSWTELRGQAEAGARLGLAAILASLGWQLPILAAARWADFVQVSYLAGIMRLVLGCNGLLQITLQAFYPILARLYAETPGRAGAMLAVLTVQAGLAGMLGVALAAGAAASLLPLILGSAFDGAVPLFRALLPVLLPVAIGSPFSYALMATGAAAALLRIQAATLAVLLPGTILGFAVIEPSAWSAMVLHPVLWGQMLASGLAARRHGLIRREAIRIGDLFNPVRLVRLARGE